MIKLILAFLILFFQASSETADITVSQGSTDLTYTGYDYDANLTATVTSISPSTLGVTGMFIDLDTEILW